MDFLEGQTVYRSNGQKVIYRFKLKDKHYVSAIHYVEEFDSDYWEDEECFPVEAVFAKPPIITFDNAIEKSRKELNDIFKEMQKKKTELIELEIDIIKKKNIRDKYVAECNRLQDQLASP